MRVFITGGSGFLGREVVRRLLERGDDVQVLVRDPKRCPVGAEPLVGDITNPLLTSLKIRPVEEVWHLAALLDLGDRRRQALHNVNVDGTLNVLNLAKQAGAGRFVLASTAYVEGRARNAYEVSKKCAERYACEHSHLNGYDLTIFRPSIIVASTETHIPPSGQGFYRFVVMLARIHRRAERLRQRVEETAKLPGIQPVFRIRAGPNVRLNLVPVDLVADAMLRIGSSGVHVLTNPLPPRMRDLANWVGEALALKTRVLRDFRMNLPEALFHRLMAPFLVYLQADIPLPPSALTVKKAPVDKEFVLETVRNAFGD